VNTATPTALPRQRHIYNTTTPGTQAHLAPDIPAEVPRLLETNNNNNNFLYPTLPTSTLSTSGTTAVSTPEQSARQEENDSGGGDTKPSASLSHTKLMAMFRKKRVALQESPQSAEGSLSSGAGRPVDKVLPQEYGLPPPYAPGYY